MTFEERRDRALALMEQTHVPRVRYEPLEYRLLWRLGAQIRPPHFGFAWRGQVTAVALGSAMLAGNDLLSDAPIAVWLAVWLGFCAMVVGLLAHGYVREAEQLGLPSWEELDRIDVDHIAVRPRVSILGLDGPRRAPDPPRGRGSPTH